MILTYSIDNIKLISLKDHVDQQLNSYKKKAIEIAIQQSTGELIVTTDADCIVSEEWLHAIASFYEKYQPAFIAAPVVYLKTNNSFLSIFQSLDFMTLQGITGASVYKKIHCMCNGANLAYTKKVFYEVNGFTGIDNIASGDDMLLMHKIYKRYPEKVLFLKSKEAIVKTKPMESLKDFFNQRIRWASKADKYEDKRIFTVLFFVYIFNVWFICLLILGIWNFSYWVLLIELSAAKTVIELFFLSPVADFFSNKKLLWRFPIAQPFHIIYTVIAGWLGKFGTYKWKERSVQ
ncbi:MAG: glycosyltransferase family 2 protein [Ferruginibacter sp.]